MPIDEPPARPSYTPSPDVRSAAAATANVVALLLGIALAGLGLWGLDAGLEARLGLDFRGSGGFASALLAGLLLPLLLGATGVVAVGLLLVIASLQAMARAPGRERPHRDAG